VVKEIVESLDAPMHMIATSGKEFRACYGAIQLISNAATVTRECAEAIGVAINDTVRIAPMKSRS